MIEILKRLSPVPIEFVNKNDDYAGTYYYGKFSITGHPYIEIDNRLKDHEKIAVLIHEISHAMCDSKNCKCMKSPNSVQLEIHAFKFQLKWLLKHKQKESLKWVIEVINFCLFRNDHYHKAAKHIMKLKLWQKCLNFVNNP